MSEVITTAQKIEATINAIESKRVNVKTVGLEKAEALIEYEKTLALTLIRLKNGEKFELRGVNIQNPPAATVEKIARGICWREALKKEKADILYRSVITSLGALEAQLNGYQSINRYLNESVS